MKPILGITMGDPSGNGPEISVKALMKPETYEVCRPLIVGDAKCMEAAIPTVKGAESMKINVIHGGSLCCWLPAVTRKSRSFIVTPYCVRSVGIFVTFTMSAIWEIM